MRMDWSTKSRRLRSNLASHSPQISSRGIIQLEIKSEKGRQNNCSIHKQTKAHYNVQLLMIISSSWIISLLLLSSHSTIIPDSYLIEIPHSPPMSTSIWPWFSCDGLNKWEEEPSIDRWTFQTRDEEEKSRMSIADCLSVCPKPGTPSSSSSLATSQPSSQLAWTALHRGRGT